MKFVLALHLLGFVSLVLSPIQARADAISKVMQKFVDDREVSGVVTLVGLRDGVEHLEAVGKSDLAVGRDMQKDDLFWIASMTKPMALPLFPHPKHL
jgi:CubicO group peptidase (beta-lactamase class C family)